VPAYAILTISVDDADAYTAYRERSPAALERYDGRYLARGGAIEAIEGDWRPERVVILEFPSLARAHEWYDSPEYRAIREIRQQAAPTRMIFVDGVAPG